MKNRRFYEIGGITVQVDADLPITDSTFHSKFRLFEVDGPGKDTVSLHHHFYLPKLDNRDLGKEVYRKPPWAIYTNGDSYIYVWMSTSPEDNGRHRVAFFNPDHTKATLYNNSIDKRAFCQGGMESLTLFPTDQILLARILADREACILHSSGLVLDSGGYLFAGHSDAGKSTLTTMLKDRAEILSDDRIIVRRWQDGFRIHGTWSHGDVPDVSPASAPLKAIMFLVQAKENRLIPMENRREINRRLLACLIKPFVTADWWEKMLTLVAQIGREVPCYELRFDKSGIEWLIGGLVN